MEYTNSYKDRAPIETYQIIKQYFDSLEFNVIDEVWQTVAGTWSSRHILLDNTQNQIVSSNGKGMTKEFCLASGYAELYERFCLKAKYWINPIILNKVKRQNYLQYGYHLDKDERIIDIEYMRKNPNIDNFLSILEEHSLDYGELFSSLNDKIIGLPYKTLKGEIEYLDPALIINCFTTTGMAAGNNFKEAFNQGFSEILERYVLKQFFTNIQDKYYAIDLSKVSNKNLQEKIINIQKDYHNIYVLDMSYNFQVPVLILLLINQNSHNVVFNVSSFPDFDIALERLLTEVYQGSHSLLLRSNYYENWRSSGQVNWSRDCYGSSMDLSTIPDSIIYNIQYNFIPNKNYFISTNQNNEIVFNYYQNLINQMKLNVYYYDYSKLDEIKAIHIYVNNLDIYSPSIEFAKHINNLSSVEIFFKEYYDIAVSVLNSGNVNLNQIWYFSNLLNDYDELERLFLASISGVDWMRLSDNTYQKSWSILDAFSELNGYELIDALQKIAKRGDIAHDPTYRLVAQYTTLYSFYLDNYSLDQIQKFISFLNLNISSKDLEKGLNKNYLFYKILLEPFYKTYYSKEYSQLLKIMFNKKI